jgi:hypothetical protein
MSEATERPRRRLRLVEDVLDDVHACGLGALAAWDEPIKSEYGEEGLGGLLVDAQCRWQRIFDARLDGVLESEAGPDAAEAVRALWQEMAVELPGARVLLDAHAGDPALTRVRERHRRRVRGATGVDLTDLQTHEFQTRATIGGTHGREHRAQRRRLRLRPVCARLHRGPVSAA